MSYRDFTLPKVQQDFGLAINTMHPLFGSVPGVRLSETLQRFLAEYEPLGTAMPTEKGRSELLVAPMLAEVWRRSGHRVSVYSGVDFNVDPEAGLNGVCDFLLGLSAQLFYVEAPVLAVVEAKKDSIADGLGQCAAEMVAAQRFNRQAQQPLDTIYGCVTTGSLWRFLRLREKQLDIDLTEYQLAQPERILGVLLHVLGVTVSPEN
jgi:hypothetical protein